MTTPDVYTEIDGLTASEMRDVVLQFALGHPADYESAVKIAHILKQGAESRGNPYASSVEAKHGRYDAPSAADVARAVPHLAQHVGANPVCSLCGLDHDAFRRSVMAVTGRRAKFGHQPATTAATELLPAHMPKGAQ